MSHPDAIVDQDLLVGGNVADGCDGAYQAEPGVVQPSSTQDCNIKHRAGEDRAPGAQNPDFHSEFRSAEGFSILFPRSAKVFGAQVKIVNPFCTTFS